MESIVWFKLSRYPWWPAKVDADHGNGNVDLITFGDDCKYNNVTASMTKPYSGHKEAYEKAALEWADRKHQSRDKVLVRKALDAAEKASQALIPVRSVGSPLKVPGHRMMRSSAKLKELVTKHAEGGGSLRAQRQSASDTGQSRVKSAVSCGSVGSIKPNSSTSYTKLEPKSKQRTTRPPINNPRSRNEDETLSKQLRFSLSELENTNGRLRSPNVNPPAKLPKLDSPTPPVIEPISPSLTHANSPRKLLLRPSTKISSCKPLLFPASVTDSRVTGSIEKLPLKPEAVTYVPVVEPTQRLDLSRAGKNKRQPKKRSHNNPRLAAKSVLLAAKASSTDVENGISKEEGSDRLCPQSQDELKMRSPPIDRSGDCRSQCTYEKFNLDEFTPWATSSQSATEPDSADQLLTPLSDANDDDDLLPSYEDLLNESRLEIKVGNLIWLKYRTYPWWPSLIVRIKNFKQKKVRIKFLNSENVPCGYSVTLHDKNVCEYPGNNYQTYVKEATSRDETRLSVARAIELADSFLSQRALGEQIKPIQYFFPNDGVESESETSSENSEAHDSPITDHWNAANESQNSQDDSRDPSLVPPPEFIFSEETKRRQKKREAWLEKVAAKVAGPACKKYLLALMKKKDLPVITHSNIFLGPFSFASNELVETLVKGVVDVYKNTLSDKEKECLVLPGVIYNSIIPRAIIYGITKVDGSTNQQATEKFFSNLMLEEEHEKYSRDIIHQGSLMTTEERAHYRLIFSSS